MPDVWKPWYVFRPWQLARRAIRAARPPADPVQVLRLPWGPEVEVDIRETIGRGLWTTGVFDLAVSEVLYRLTPAGAVAVDAGANIGYMTGLLAVRAGAAGRVLAAEPNPEVLPRLRANVARLARVPGAAPVEVVPAALSDAPGRGRLVYPPGFAAKHGVGRLAGPTDDAVAGHGVATRCLDDLVPDGPVGMLKLDVEGHEPAVLRGAGRLLAGGRVRHVVFESHAGPGGEAGRRLAAAGYTLFQIGWEMTGPVLAAPDGSRVCKPYEAPSFLATTDPAGAAAACRPAGWAVLGRSVIPSHRRSARGS